MKHSVYSLVDPRDGAIYYIGITKDLKRRYGQHCSLRDVTTRTCKWIKGLIDQGLKPLLLIIEEVDGWDAAYARETYWINFMLDEGEPLMNYVTPARRQRKEAA